MFEMRRYVTKDGVNVRKNTDESNEDADAWN